MLGMSSHQSHPAVGSVLSSNWVSPTVVLRITILAINNMTRAYVLQSLLLDPRDL